ncbi:hypothetical protein BGZ74_003047 [Mortierella antarctica]|nr:hypothetical protein BGZ74_003047 [Mortierella antarctica]
MESGVIAVIGTTGVGKSNLSIQLAKELDGEVINGDALQVYKGLDIITNKMPIEEREGVEHHLMDFLPMESEYTVLDFKADALQLNAGTLSDTQVQEGTRANEAFLRDSDTATLYKKLQKVDPLMANKWHENDRRKITRSLQVFFETGQCQSDLIKKQHAVADSERLRMPTCIFWVYSASDILNARLDARVDVMIKGGLFEEIQRMRKSVGTDTDYERGIWQAIGYKEFDPYFTALEKAVASNEPTDTTELEALKIFLLDATSLDTWKEKVGNVAVKIAKDFFAGNPLPNPESLNQYAKDMLVAQRDLDAVSALESWEKKECKICTDMQRLMHDKYGKGASEEPPAPVIIHGPTSWEQHLRSRQHRKYKTNQTEMERDGSNWWFFRAQEYKKRKREGTLNEDGRTEDDKGNKEPAEAKEEGSTSSGLNASKLRRTSLTTSKDVSNE